MIYKQICGRDRSGYPTARKRNEVERPSEEYERTARIVRPKKVMISVILKYDINVLILKDENTGNPRRHRIFSQ